MTEAIQDKIKSAIREWTPDLVNLYNHQEIIALNFGALRLDDGYELYLSGHTWYDGHDLWLLGEEWSPKQNYVSLGQDSLSIDRLEILDEYERIVKEEIENSKDLYKDLIVVVGLVDGDYKRLK